MRKNFHKKSQTKKFFDFKNQTRLVEGRKDGARISSINHTDLLPTNYYADVKTLYEVFLKGKEISSIVIFKCLFYSNYSKFSKLFDIRQKKSIIFKKKK